jgi:hypothetical protein
MRTLLLPDRLDELADEILGGFEKMFERASVVRSSTAAGDVGSDVEHGCFEAVQPVVEPTEICLDHDRLTVGNPEGLSAAAGLEGPLPVGGGAELPRSP